MAGLLSIRGLNVSVADQAVLRDVDLDVYPGEMVGLVGESGCGKTSTALAILGLLPPGLCRSAGRILFAGREISGLVEEELRRLRGSRIGMVFQEPAGALTPTMTIGRQIEEVVRWHRDLSGSAARDEALRLLELVRMPDPAVRMSTYPHQLSGGQRQRAMIAVALAGKPDLLLADEPTTALDVTVQAEILALLIDLCRHHGLSVLLMTHNLAAVTATCDRVLVMYDGTIIEDAPVDAFVECARHPYSRELLQAAGHRGERPARQRPTGEAGGGRSAPCAATE